MNWYRPGLFLAGVVAFMVTVAIVLSSASGASDQFAGRLAKTAYACDATAMDRIHEITSAYRKGVAEGRAALSYHSNSGQCGFVYINGKPPTFQVAQTLVVSSDAEGDVFFWFYPEKKDGGIFTEALFLTWEEYTRPLDDI